MQSSLPINLVFSLLFGIGQVVGWVWLVASGRRRWQNGRIFLLLLAGAWFVCSGIIELFVSSLESSHLLIGSPDSTSFALWRGRADTVLAIATGVIVLSGLLVVLSGRLTWQRPASVSGDSRDME